MALKDSEPLDLILTGLAHLHRGGVQDCSQFLDTVFGFLARKTRFYTATSTATARKVILDKFQTYGAVAIKAEQKKRGDLKKSKKRKKGLSMSCEAASSSQSKIQKLTTAEEAETHKQQKVHEKEGSINKISADDSIPSSSKNTAQVVSKDIIDVGHADLHNFPRTQNLSEGEIRWSLQVPGFPPRSEHVAVAVGNVIYSFGGFTRGGHPSPAYLPNGPLDVFVLNVNDSEMKWRILPTKNNKLLNQRSPHSAMVYKDSVLIYGGRDAKTKKSSNSIHSLNTKTLTWDRVKVTGNIPKARPHYKAVVVGEQLIVLGGSEYDFELHSLDLVTFHWSKMETKFVEYNFERSSPRLRFSSSATVYDGKIYIFGGWVRDCEFRKNSNDLLCLNVHLKEWTVHKASETTPCSRKDHGAFLHSGHIFIFGGSPKPRRSNLDDLFSYDPVSCKWKEIKPIGSPPSPRWNFGCVALGNRVFVFGGEKGNKDYLDDTFVLEMGDPMVWKPQSGETLKSVTMNSISVITSPSSLSHLIGSQNDPAEITAGEETQIIEYSVGDKANTTNTTSQDTSKPVPVEPRNCHKNDKNPWEKNTDNENHGSIRYESNEKMCLEGASIKINAGIHKVKIEPDSVTVPKVELLDDLEKRELYEAI